MAIAHLHRQESARQQRHGGRAVAARLCWKPSREAQHDRLLHFPIRAGHLDDAGTAAAEPAAGGQGHRLGEAFSRRRVNRIAATVQDITPNHRRLGRIGHGVTELGGHRSGGRAAVIQAEQLMSERVADTAAGEQGKGGEGAEGAKAVLQVN
ncbi:hypothetical protein GT370_09665 [Acidocella sp. MX-AZ03]|nr:hypothetical protein [Acidocella sp. MX-AZ03]WBO60954.1 hypothetical protein GT370_09665 [Acidocella sp. MX-AZ03]